MNTQTSKLRQPHFNFYCDESCHLATDGDVAGESRQVMAIGGVWCAQDKVPEVVARLKEIKASHGIDPTWELKWNKVSPSKERAYLAILDYFFDDDDLHFRAAVVPDKRAFLQKYGNHNLRHDHDEHYYRLYFDMLKVIFDPRARYNIYLDPKDTRGRFKLAELRKKLCDNSFYEVPEGLIGHMQEVRSFETGLLQLTDLLLGALTFVHRRLDEVAGANSAKKAFVARLRQRTGYSLLLSTLHREEKVNLYIWHNSHHPFDKQNIDAVEEDSGELIL